MRWVTSVSPAPADGHCWTRRGHDTGIARLQPCDDDNDDDSDSDLDDNSDVDGYAVKEEDFSQLTEMERRKGWRFSFFTICAGCWAGGCLSLERRHLHQTAGQTDMLEIFIKTPHHLLSLRPLT